MSSVLTAVTTPFPVLIQPAEKADSVFLFLFGCLSVSLSSPFPGQGSRVWGDPPDIDVLSFETHLKVLRFLPSHPAWT